MKNLNDDHFISVIIPTVGRDTLDEVLKALENQTRKADEIIVAHDVERKGISYARNRGILQSKGDLIAFLDDDNLPGENWLEKFVYEIDKNGADGVSSGYIESDDFLQEIRLRRNIPEEKRWNLGGIFGIGGNVMYKRECLVDSFEKYGYAFNPNLIIADDIELGWRLINNKYRLLYINDNKITHLKKLDSKQFLRHQFNRGKSIFELYELKNKFNHADLGKSLLWEDKSKIKRFFKLVFKIVFGPFDISSFKSKRNYFLFWLGEKYKTAGFIHFMYQKKYN